MSDELDIAKAVVETLKAHSFSQQFTPQADWVPGVDLEKLSTIHVTASPKGLTITPANRVQYYDDHEIWIGVQKKFVSGDRAEQFQEADALLGLVKEIREYLAATKLLGDTGAQFISLENDPIFDQTHFEEKGVFTSLITATYKKLR